MRSWTKFGVHRDICRSFSQRWHEVMSWTEFWGWIIHKHLKYRMLCLPSGSIAIPICTAGVPIGADWGHWSGITYETRVDKQKGIRRIAVTRLTSAMTIATPIAATIMQPWRGWIAVFQKHFDLYQSLVVGLASPCLSFCMQYCTRLHSDTNILLWNYALLWQSSEDCRRCPYLRGMLSTDISSELPLLTAYTDV